MVYDAPQRTRAGARHRRSNRRRPRRRGIDQQPIRRGYDGQRVSSHRRTRAAVVGSAPGGARRTVGAAGARLVRAPMSLSRSELVALDKQRVWHPYTEMGSYIAETDPLVIARAEGSRLFGVDGRSYLDANSSWWGASLR